nr:RNA-directed DNA polymerase, eukaryota [Tanacetum cinerariifolium]
GYGTVVDVYIPNHKSKAGKRFAFVRFIKVDNVDRLVSNLSTLWIGRMHLLANVARYERASINSSRPTQPMRTGNHVGNHVAKSAPLVVPAAKGIWPTPLSASPALILDESCLVNPDLDNYIMGEVKLFSSINNLLVLLSNEGFSHIKVVYLGGLYVMIELPTAKSKSKFLNHVGVASWFNALSDVQPDFIPRDRIVWVDIEGVHMHAWSRNTFHKIGTKWGEVLDLEESRDDFFVRKRICIKTNQEDNILEKFKIIVKGKIFVVRAKELFVWSPMFTEVPETTYCSDDDSDKGAGVNLLGKNVQPDLQEESDHEAVFETFFGVNVEAFDSLIISSLKIDSLLDEFANELTLLSSSPRPSEEFISKNSDAAIESFSPSPVLIEDSDSLRDDIDLSLTPDDSMPPGIEDDDYESKGDMLILEELLTNDSLSLPENESFHFDIPSSPHPLAKPPDNDEIEPNSGILTI